jgi:hypothetical protein
MKKTLSTLIFLFVLSLTATYAFAGADIIIVNVNAPGVGFNDPTAAAPIGGNPGTTRGQQALNVFTRAAQIWGQSLDSGVQIRVEASFEPRTCTTTSAVLGSAGTKQAEIDFAGAEFPNTWYHEALANKRSGVRLNPDNDIRARFNSELGKPGCLDGTTWYFGLDDLEATGQIDLLAVVLHEIGHGLGFATFVNKVAPDPTQPLSEDNPAVGHEFFASPDIYERYVSDDVSGSWLAMTDDQRAASMVHDQHLVWVGSKVHAAVPQVLSGTPRVTVNSPAAVAGSKAIGTAGFGAPLSSPGITSDLVYDPSLGCVAVTPAVSGKIAMIDRGTCTFVVKVKNAQNAGALAVIIADNAPGAPAGLGGADPTITIPSVRISQADGAAIKGQLLLGPVNVTMDTDLTHIAGANAALDAKLYAPAVIAPGSSVSHWDVSETPNQLMEPFINGDLIATVKVPKDLSESLMRDIGWYPDADTDLVPDDSDACANSAVGATISIGGISSGVPDKVFSNGCSIKQRIDECAAGATNRGGFNSCVAHVGDDAAIAGMISSAQKDALQSAAARAKIGK